VEHISGLLGLIAQYPDIAAAILGIFLSMCCTQFVKMFLPDSMPTPRYRLLVQLIGFVSGWVFTHGAWILFDPSSGHFERLYASAGCGFASPAIYSMLIPWLTSKWPAVGRALSGRPDAPPAGGTVDTGQKP